VGGNGWTLYCDKTTAKLTLVVGLGGAITPPTYNTMAGSVCTPNVWQTYVVTYAAGSWSVYVNGATNTVSQTPSFTLASSVIPSGAGFIPLEMNLGNSESENDGWQGGLLDFAFFNYTVSAAQLATLTPFNYRTWLCACPAGSELETQTYAFCTNNQDTSRQHNWFFDDDTEELANPISDDGDANSADATPVQGTQAGAAVILGDFDINELVSDLDSMFFPPGSYLTGTFEAGEQTFAAASWTVTSYFARTSVLTAQAVLSGGASSMTFGFNPATPTQFGLFQQSTPTNGVYVTTSGTAGNVFFVAVSYLASWNNVTVWVREVGTNGMSTWKTAHGTFANVDTNMGAFVLGGQSAATTTNAQVGGFVFAETRIYPRALTANEIIAYGGQQVSATGIVGLAPTSNGGGGGTTGGTGGGTTGGGGTGTTGGGGGASSSTTNGGGPTGNSTSSAPAVAFSATVLTMLAGAAAL